MLISGTASADTLLGLAGDDTIFGWEGNDRILASSGNNIVNGNKGDDTIYGGSGNDLLRGGTGNDILYDDKGDSTIFGDKGNDLIFVGAGNNIINGNEGNDTIYGSSGNDLLRGGKNSDLIFGDVGNDTIYGDWGADTLTGKDGNDIFVIGRTNNAITRTTGGLNRKDADVITDFEKGRDLILLTGGLSYTDLDIQQGIDIDTNNTIIKDKFTGEYLVVLLNNPSSSINESIFIAETTSFSGVANNISYIGNVEDPTDRDPININSLALNELVKLPTNLNTNEDTDLVFNNPNTISEQDINLFNSPIKVTLTTKNGKLTLNSTDGLTFNNGNNGSAYITFTGNVSSINSAINKFTFTPDRNFNGNTSILVLAEIDSLVGLAANKISSTIPVTVNPVNDAPVNTVPGNQIINENEPLIFNGDKAISIADIDAGDSPVQVTLTTNNGKLNLNTTNGLVFNSSNNGDRYMSFSGKIGNVNAALNNLIFTPDSDFNGNTSVSIITDDLGNTGGGNLSDRDTININVVRINQAPVNIVPNRQAILQNTPFIFNTSNNNLISISDSDASNNPIQVTLSTNNGTLSLSGTNGLTFSDGTLNNSSKITFFGTISNINTAINGLTFTPTSNFIGNTNISLTTNDLGNSGSGGAKITSSSIPINVGNANNIPVNQVPGKQVTTSNTPIIFNSANNNQIIISDSDAGNNSIQVTLSANSGDLFLKETTGLTFIGGTANNSASITITSTIFDINKALDGLTFSPKNSFKGDDEIVIITNDLGNTGVGGSQIVTSKIPITVNPYTVSITPLNSNFIREGNSSKFTISRDGSFGDLPISLTVDSSSTITSFAGGAFPVDYTLSGGSVTIESPARITVTIPDGKSSADIVFSANKDDHAEADEILKLNIANTINYNINTTQKNAIFTIKGGSTGGTVVSSTKDDASLSNYAFVEGTLRQAIANSIINWSIKDTITFNLPQTSPKITLTGNLRQIDDLLEINGGVNKVTIDGNNQYQIFNVYNTEAIFKNLIIVNGKGSNNRAGGIHIQGSKVTASDSIFFQNTSTARGGAIHNSSDSILEIINSSFANNISDSFTGGGAISNSGNLTIINSTISNNSAFPFIGGGGGIANNGTITLNNSTIAKNYSDNSGGGIYNAGTVIASHTIIADNNTDSGSSPDFDGTLESKGYNLIGNKDGVNIIGNLTGNILNQSAKLDSLKDNGGLTRTMALLVSSPAINAGDPNFNSPNLLYDQRGVGFDRVLHNRIDIGAFESNFF